MNLASEIKQENRMARLEKGQETIVSELVELKEMVKENHSQTQALFSNFDLSLRKSIDCKADTKEVDELNKRIDRNDSRLYNLVVSGFFQAIAVIVAIVMSLLSYISKK